MKIQASAVYVLAVYPISLGFRENVSHVTGPDAQYLLLAELRTLGLRGMLTFLRRMNKGSVIYLPLEDGQSKALLPLLLGVAAFSSAGRVMVVQSDGSVRAIGRAQTISAILGVAISSLIGIVCLLRCWFSVGRLGRIRRQSPALPHDANRILYINANLWFGVRAGGSVGHIAGVVNAFADSGFHVDLVSANAQVMLRDSVRQSLLQAPKTFGFPYELNYFRCNYRALRQLKRFAASRRYRFVYQRMSVINYVGVALSRLLHVPFVLEYNGSEIWVAKNWGRPLHFSRLGLAIENICLSHAYRVVVVSRVLADELVERGIERDRIVWYPNCVDPKHYSPEVVRPEAAAELRKRHGISADAVLIAFVGTFGVWHGAPVLAAAIKQLVDRDSRWLEENSVRFAMIGDGLKMKDVCELIGGAAYSPWVVFVGLVPQPDTVQYLAVADILVSPHIRNGDGSRFFGSPTKLFEYMAMAKAIIASDLDQIGEVLSSGIRVWDREMQELTSTTGATAVLARPGNIDDLVAGMKLLVERRGLRTQVGLNARAELLRRYTWRHHVAHILAALGEGSTEEADDAAVA